MDKEVKCVTPRYQQIAADVAAKIADKHYKVGEKIYARSALASQYGVSSETARRAICILADMKIVETAKGSGVVVKSYENAVNFVRHYQDIQSISDLKQEIVTIIERQIQGNDRLREGILKLMDKTDRFKSINPFVPFEIVLNPLSPLIGRNLSETNFWHNTSATVIGIRREDVLLLSPGPYACLLAGDILYFVGDENCYERVKNFLDHYPSLENASTPSSISKILEKKDE